MDTRFILLSKTVGESFNKYRGNCIRLSSQLPYTYDEVVIGSVSNPFDLRRVTTFRDSLGNITERIFDFNNKPVRNQLYEYAKNDIGQEESVTTSILHEYQIDRETLGFYKNLEKSVKVKKKIAFWDRVKAESTHSSVNRENGTKVISRTTVKTKDVSNKQVHSFEEFPHIVSGKIDKAIPKKTLAFEVSPIKGVVNKKSVVCDNAQMPANDSFISLRALPIEDAKIPLTQMLLRRRHPDMERVKVKIVPDLDPSNRSVEEQKFVAKFDHLTGELGYNREHIFASKSELASVAGHEDEHVWQRYLCARLSNSSIPWERNIYETFGLIEDKQLLSEAKDYNKSFWDYIPFFKDFKGYTNNLVEKKADEAGDRIKQEYIEQGKDIRESFSHIPAELL